MSWEHDGYIYYGSDIAGLPTPQQRNENNCWARALAALVGVPWSTVAVNAKLDDLVKGQSTLDTRLAVERFNMDFAKAGEKVRLSETARWYDHSWQQDMLEQKFPAAVGITGHFVVVLGIGVSKTQGKPRRICYWDTDCQVYYEDLQTFIDKNKPEMSFVSRHS